MSPEDPTIPEPPVAGAPAPGAGEPTSELHALGLTLMDRAEDVLSLTLERSRASEQHVDAVVQESFERISRSSTIAVARWISGEGLQVAREAGSEMWLIFGELAAQRASSLDDVIRRCLWWRDAMVEVIDHECGRPTHSRRRSGSRRPRSCSSASSSASCGWPSASSSSEGAPTRSSAAARRSSRSWPPTTL